MKPSHHHGNILIGAFGNGHGKQHEVGAHRKVRRLVAHHQTDPLMFGPRYRLVGHAQGIGADGIHLRVKAQAEHPVTQIDYRRSAVALHHLAANP